MARVDKNGNNNGQTAAAAAALTVTLPAGAAGEQHLISRIEVTCFSSTARTGSATPVIVTTTNLGGLRAVFSSAGALGACDRWIFEPSAPVVGDAPATPTTIVCPAMTGITWFVSVNYITG